MNQSQQGSNNYNDGANTANTNNNAQVQPQGNPQVQKENTNEAGTGGNYNDGANTTATNNNAPMQNQTPDNASVKKE